MAKYRHALCKRVRVWQHVLVSACAGSQGRGAWRVPGPLVTAPRGLWRAVGHVVGWSGSGARCARVGSDPSPSVAVAAA